MDIEKYNKEKMAKAHKVYVDSFPSKEAYRKSMAERARKGWSKLTKKEREERKRKISEGRRKQLKK